MGNWYQNNSLNFEKVSICKWNSGVWFKRSLSDVIRNAALVFNARSKRKLSFASGAPVYFLEIFIDEQVCKWRVTKSETSKGNCFLNFGLLKTSLISSTNLSVVKTTMSFQ